MEQKINIAALLKDCPKGTKLYSPICGECELSELKPKIEDTDILIRDPEDTEYWGFDKYGRLNSEKYGECLLFPSKEVRDWGCFRVKYAKGIVFKGEYIKALLQANGGIDDGKYDFENEDCIYFIDRVNSLIKAFGKYESNDAYKYILSTGTELKLEEEQPKFKVGDIVTDKSGATAMVNGIMADSGTLIFLNETCGKTDNLDYNGFVDELHLATPEEIAKWNKETLEPNHLHYSTSKRKIIDWFLPFDKVVVRFEEDKSVNWIASFYSHFNGKDFVCVDGTPYAQCLPYDERTARLIGTTDDYEEE